jgi:hypothetical protein
LHPDVEALDDSEVHDQPGNDVLDDFNPDPDPETGARRSAYYGGPRVVHWNGNFAPATQPVDEEPGYFDTHDTPAGSAAEESDPDPGPQIEVRNRGLILQILFNGVTTQRALRRKRDELGKCRQGVRDADSMMRKFQLKTTSGIPATDEEWNMHNATLGEVTEWKATLGEQQNLEKNLDLQIEFLGRCAEKWTRRAEIFQRSTARSHRLLFWSKVDGFWQAFDRCQATSETLVDIGRDLEQSNEDIGEFNLVLDRKLRHDLDFQVDEDGSCSTTGDEFAYQDISRIPDLFQKHKELQQHDDATRSLYTAQWIHLLRLAEETFVKDEILELAEESDEEDENHETLSQRI